MIKSVFADTNYWIAIISPADQWHLKALDASRRIADRKLLTTDEVLTELLNYFAEHKPERRKSVAENVQKYCSTKKYKLLTRRTKIFSTAFNSTKIGSTKVTV